MSAIIESWIESGNDPHGDFPLNNLPYGVFSIGDEAPRCCTIIGDRIVDLAAIERKGCFDLHANDVFEQTSLNTFMALGGSAHANVRNTLIELLAADSGKRGTHAKWL